jgi:RNA polymerase sigma-70 factor, ECF subfamily
MSISLPALAARVNDGTTEITASDFALIVSQHQKRVYRVLFLMLKNAEDADNLTQDCFLRAYTTRAQFRGECSVQTWLLRIAVNLARDHVKSRRASFWKRLVGLDGDGPDPVPEPVAGNPSAERGLIARETLDAVWQTVEQLSQRQKEVFLLRFVEEMELREIAEILDLNIGTVKAQLFRAVSRVREQVAR